MNSSTSLRGGDEPMTTNTEYHYSGITLLQGTARIPLYELPAIYLITRIQYKRPVCHHELLFKTSKPHCVEEQSIITQA
jgi:hypothetical protein